MSTKHQLLQVNMFHLLPHPLRFICPQLQRTFPPGIDLNDNVPGVDVNGNYLEVDINVDFIGNYVHGNLLGDNPNDNIPPDKPLNWPGLLLMAKVQPSKPSWAIPTS